MDWNKPYENKEPGNEKESDGNINETTYGKQFDNLEPLHFNSETETDTSVWSYKNNSNGMK